MNKIFSLLLLVTCFLISCKQPATPPTQVLDSMFTTMKKGDIQGMKKFITKSDVAMLETAEKFMTKIDPEGIEKLKTGMTEEIKERSKHIDYNFVNEKIDGDHATVEAEIIDNSPSDSIKQKKTTQTFELVKEDNTWKIALMKPGNQMFNSMKGNMGKKNKSLKDGIEKLKQMDPDSLKMLINKGIQLMDSLKNSNKNQ